MTRARPGGLVLIVGGVGLAAFVALRGLRTGVQQESAEASELTAPVSAA
jgi:hypothetical protein